MLPKQHRLPLRKELNRVKKEGRMFSDWLFGLLLARQPQAGPTRFGMIVSNKIHRKAVKRNRIRRLLSEAIQLSLPQVKPGFDGVFLVKKKIVNQKFDQVKLAVKRVFQKADLLQ